MTVIPLTRVRQQRRPAQVIPIHPAPDPQTAPVSAVLELVGGHLATADVVQDGAPATALASTREALRLLVIAARRIATEHADDLDQLDAAKDALFEVAQLHDVDEDNPFGHRVCRECHVHWPCATRLLVERAPGGDAA